MIVHPVIALAGCWRRVPADHDAARIVNEGFSELLTEIQQLNCEDAVRNRPPGKGKRLDTNIPSHHIL